MSESKWPFLTPGIPDGFFQRQEGIPMTKEEIRVLTLAKARLGPGQTVYDVGAGTGSLTVEAARLVSPGRVYAVEIEPAAVDLVRANAGSFGLRNVELVAGAAPAALAGLPRADRVLVGGSGGELVPILEVCLSKLKAGGRLVVNAVTWETLLGAVEFARGRELAAEVVSVNVARLAAAGRRQLWRSLNPVYIITLSV